MFPVALVITLLVPAMTPTIASAQTVDGQKQKVEEIVDQLDRLEEKSNQLAEDYIEAVDTKSQLDVEIVDAEAQIAVKEAELDQLRGSLSEMALRSYVGGGAAPLGPLFEDSSNLSDGIQRDELARVALSAGDVTSDELDALVSDLDDDRDALARKREQADELADSLVAQQEATEKSTKDFEEAKADAEAKLGDLIAQEEARRAAESARQHQAAVAAAAAAAAAAANNNSAAATSNNNSGGATANTNTGGGSSSNSSGNAGGSPAAAPAPASAPAVSSRSGIAISAAMGQQGVPYRFAASSPGVAFDCSGLTAYAWAQAGVFLPHQSRQQYASVPHVSQGEAQPGDLLFYYSPISHVGIYLGGGQLVHAPNTGSVVNVASVNWGKVTGVGRPG